MNDGGDAMEWEIRAVDVRDVDDLCFFAVAQRTETAFELIDFGAASCAATAIDEDWRSL